MHTAHPSEAGTLTPTNLDDTLQHCSTRSDGPFDSVRATHRYRRNVYVTPKSFLSFLTAYSETYVRKKDELAELASSINTGLEKLAQATEDVCDTAPPPQPSCH